MMEMTEPTSPDDSYLTKLDLIERTWTLIEEGRKDSSRLPFLEKRADKTAERLRGVITSCPMSTRTRGDIKYPDALMNQCITGKGDYPAPCMVALDSYRQFVHTHPELWSCFAGDKSWDFYVALNKAKLDTADAKKELTKIRKQIVERG